ncbi:GDP-mannose 4,6-dehydratase [Desulfosarcina alkanivorans]|uniref:GDP-mannose 4,6-dehydratase n=1 Tax=Desulfosarcina alkanivorans TaxID=571177 RepID=A0A5K7YGU7_9BACT|nr:GDP-mannose 4,6-dehydratase [Desulfosarcina alkanivorans]BBO67049.1 GDP-mannose 4,6-dehydratase [Desulfosarcina alkanivorans]
METEKKAYSNKKAMIIGVSGQDGSYLAKLLLEKGYEVWGTSRDAQISSFHNLHQLGIRDQVSVASMTLNDFRSVIQVLSRISPEEIYNLAGQTSVGLSFEQPMETFESITIGTLNLLEALRFLKLPAKLYNASSSECFGNTNGDAATETTPFRPRSPYAAAKAAAFWQTANYREAYGIFTCSGILFNHESPLRPKRFVTQKIVKAAVDIAAGRCSELKLGNIDIARDWGWAPEYVKAMWLMLQRDEPEDYIVATGKTYALREFVQAVFEHLNLDWERYTSNDNKLLRPTDILISRAKPSKVDSFLGWRASYDMCDVARMMVDAELSMQD